MCRWGIRLPRFNLRKAVKWFMDHPEAALDEYIRRWWKEKSCKREERPKKEECGWNVKAIGSEKIYSIGTDKFHLSKAWYFPVKGVYRDRCLLCWGFYEKILIHQGKKNKINIPNKIQTEHHSTLFAICEQAKTRLGSLVVLQRGYGSSVLSVTAVTSQKRVEGDSGAFCCNIDLWCSLVDMWCNGRFIYHLSS